MYSIWQEITEFQTQNSMGKIVSFLKQFGYEEARKHKLCILTRWAHEHAKSRQPITLVFT